MFLESWSIILNKEEKCTVKELRKVQKKKIFNAAVETFMKPVLPELVGEIWPSAQPLDDSSLYGRVDFSPTGAFEVRSLQTFTLVYTVDPVIGGK